MKLDIDLDENQPTPIGGPLTPESHGPTVVFHYDEPIKLPKYGRLVVEYELQHESVNKRKGEKPDYACTVEICHLVSVKEIKEQDEDESGDVPKSSNSAKETENALDEHAAAYEKE